MGKQMELLFMMNYVDTYFNNSIKNSDEIAKNFCDYLCTLSNEDFIDKLIITGYIPDIYENDSSQETIFTKLVEVMTYEWARRMGFKSEYVKQKASYQDVNIEICGKTIVCDSKSFRLGRSQAAPNVKDFLKLADISKWLERYPKNQRLGGLVVYPCKHEWTKGSDAYQYCSNKNIPTVMLPYKYLAFLLKNVDKYNSNDLAYLWNYNKIFPKVLKNKNTNKNEYWQKMNSEIIKITNTTKTDLESFLNYSNRLINNYININIFYLENIIDTIKIQKKKQLDEYDKEKLEQLLLDLMIKENTKGIEQSINNINKFRVEKEKADE